MKKHYWVTFTTIIDVYAIDEDEAKTEACKIWDEMRLRRDEMNIEVIDDESKI